MAVLAIVGLVGFWGFGVYVLFTHGEWFGGALLGLLLLFGVGMFGASALDE
jgi:hypothetical protein